MELFKQKEIFIVFKSYEEDNDYFLCDDEKIFILVRKFYKRFDKILKFVNNGKDKSFFFYLKMLLNILFVIIVREKGFYEKLFIF